MGDEGSALIPHPASRIPHPSSLIPHPGPASRLRCRPVRWAPMNPQTELRRELGLADLVLMQVVFVVGSGWVGTAAKLGPSQLVFWLVAIATYYLPQAAV